MNEHCVPMSIYCQSKVFEPHEFLLFYSSLITMIALTKQQLSEESKICVVLISHPFTDSNMTLNERFIKD